MKTKKIVISVLSIVIPVVVVFLLNMNRVLPQDTVDSIRSFDGSFLPPMYATINAITAIVLIAAVIMVKKGNIKLHEKLIKFAMLLSVLFLVGYVIYHLTTPEALYGDLNHDGIRDDAEKAAISSSFAIYLFLLISHITLSLGVIPLVLMSYLYGSTNQVEKHKKLVKWAFPLWLYIAITGVVIYFMISPYYA